MGGRGTSSGVKSKTQQKSRFQSAKPKENSSSMASASTQEAQKKMATSGTKVQQSFIEYVQKQTGVNLSSARDTQFDTRSYFNVDTRKLGSNGLRTVQSLIRQYDGGYDVTISDNGANRKAIYVKRKKRQ
jgi:hypothetical protein